MLQAPSPTPGLAIGEYAHASGFTLSHRPDDWIVVLTSPSVQRLDWFAATTSGVRRPSVPTSAGLLVADSGQVTAPVQLTGLATSHGNLRTRGVLIGIPGNGPALPDLAAPPALRPPASFRFIDGWPGQGSRRRWDSV